MKENQPIHELVGISKPPDWIGMALDEVSKYMEEKSEDFNYIVNSYLLQKGDLKFILSLNLNGLEDSLADITRLFYAIGYMRGRVVQEELDKLEGAYGK